MAFSPFAATESTQNYGMNSWFQRIKRWIDQHQGMFSATTSYTVTEDIYNVRADATAGSFTVTLPPALDKEGRTIVITKIDSSVNSVKIVPMGSDTIAGQTQYNLLTQWSSVTLLSNAVDGWDVIQQTGSVSTGAIPVGLIKFGALNMVQNTTRFAQAIGIIGTATQTNGQLTVQKDITVSALRVLLNAAVAASQTFTITVQKNGTDTALTAQVTAGNTTASDLVNSITFRRGDLFSIKIVASATTGSTTEVNITLVSSLVNTNIGAPLLYLGAVDDGATYHGEMGLFASGVGSATETDVQAAMPECVVKNGFQTAAGFNRNAIIMSVPTVYETFDTYFAANDFISYDGGPGASAFVIEAVNGSSYAPCPLLFSAVGQVQNVTRYMRGWGVAGTATENESQIAMPACTIRNLRALASAAPAAGQTITLTVMKNGVATAVTAQITSAGRIVTDLSNTATFIAGDLLSIRSVTSATSGTRSIHATIEAFL